MSVFRPAVYATVLKGFLPDSFSNCWQPNALRRNEDFHLVLRNNEEFAAPFARISFIERLLFTRIPKTWIKFNNENINLCGTKKCSTKNSKIIL
jgi:hypothetical protein